MTSHDRLRRSPSITTHIALAGAIALIGAGLGATRSVADVQLPGDWSEMDLDSDFYVTADEVAKAAPSMDFAAADKDGDGNLSRVEFSDYVESLAKPAAAKKGPIINAGKGAAPAVVNAKNDSAKAGAAPTASRAAANAGSTRSALDAIAATPKGELANPYLATDTAVAERGHELWFETGCNGCHGGTGGGGMCPALTNKRWVYGDDPDTLFRLIALGSQELQANGYSRIAREGVVGYMPAQHMILQTEDDLWKIITWIQSLHLD
ncbi:MAG: c-type cytochrome [Pseudomonadota bacterium]